MEPLRQRLPGLKVVFEHITTKDAAEYVRDGNELLAATITPQHLMFNRNHMLVGGVRPHLYCLPILKRNIHQQALRELVASGFDRAFLGTDSAPHARHRKEASCGCAGCFNAPTALGSYATVFEEMNALQHFEAFCSLNGPASMACRSMRATWSWCAKRARWSRVSPCQATRWCRSLPGKPCAGR